MYKYTYNVVCFNAQIFRETIPFQTFISQNVLKRIFK